jgi:hypothetical protein
MALENIMSKGDFLHISDQLMPQKCPSCRENKQNIAINMHQFHSFG